MDSQDRTEAPTPRRLQRAKEAGQVPFSTELGLFASLSAAGLLLAFAVPPSALQLRMELAALTAHLDQDPAAAVRRIISITTRDMAPVLIFPPALVIVTALLQNGLSFTGAPIHFDLSRLNPVRGLSRLFGSQSLLETGKSLAKLSVVSLVVWRVVVSQLPNLATEPYSVSANPIPAAVHLATRLLLALLILQAAISLLDLTRTRASFLRRMRMSRQELRDETKETEGDPFLKARFRRLRQQRARKRMLAAVPQATVVITNPTEYAVALAYDRARPGAPRLVAKGVDHMAARIRRLAAQHAIPLVANPPLARALYPLDPGTEIPPEHYKAVAEVIAYVWRLRLAPTIAKT